jgi:hypothetical protein
MHDLAAFVGVVIMGGQISLVRLGLGISARRRLFCSGMRNGKCRRGKQ